MEQDDVFNLLAGWGFRQPLVRAMLLTSSRAVPNAPVDVLSDYDVILIVTTIHPFYDDRSWLQDFGRVLVMYRDPLRLTYGFETFGNVTQYESGLKIDFSVWPVEAMRAIVDGPHLPEEFDAGYRVLLDKDGLTTGLQLPTYRGYIPSPPFESQYLETIESFFLDCAYAAKFLWRDDLVAARHIMDHEILQENLRTMLIWLIEIENEWNVKPGPYGRRLKRDLRSDLWLGLEKMFVGPNLEENWKALFYGIELFRQAAQEVGDHCEFTYPLDLDRRVEAYLNRVKRLDPPVPDV